MKKLGSLVILALVSSLALANEATETNNLTLAAADTNSANWTRETSRLAPEARLDKVFEEKTLEMSEKINAQLEKALEEKLNREIVF